MKRLLCYLGILVLFCLTLLPPILRITLPDYSEEKTEETIVVTTILSCTSDDFIVNTSYENENIRMIVMKKMNEVENLPDDDSDTQIEETENELLTTFLDLKTKGGVTNNILEDGEVIALDFKLYTFENLNLTKFTKKIQEQQTYYESQGLTCITRK